MYLNYRSLKGSGLTIVIYSLHRALKISSKFIGVLITGVVTWLLGLVVIDKE